MMNCIVIDDDLLSRNLAETYIKKVDFLNILQSFSDPISALSFLSKNNVDLIFLDIEMPEMNGMKFIETIQQKMPQIILTTSHTGFAIQAFEYDVTDYLVKPLDYSRFYKAIMKAKNIFDNQALHHINDDSVFVKKGTSIIRILKSSILWVEALGDYVVLNTGNERIVVYTTMKEMERKLSPNDYMRVHRSYIIRIDKIDTVEENTISYNEKIIPIGKSYRESVFKRLKML
jgi:DNA-binding LytR/AlgR family response regulator